MQTLNQCKVYVKSLEFYLVLADTMCMTTHNASRQYIAADLTARAEAAGIDIHDEWDFPLEPLTDDDLIPDYDDPSSPHYQYWTDEVEDDEDGTAGFLHHSFWEK